MLFIERLPAFRLVPTVESWPLWNGISWLFFRVGIMRVPTEQLCTDWAIGAAIGRRDPEIWQRYLSGSALVSPGSVCTFNVKDDGGVTHLVRGVIESASSSTVQKIVEAT